VLVRWWPGHAGVGNDSDSCSLLDQASRYGSRHRRAHERHEFWNRVLTRRSEGAADGAIGLVRDGDLITVDADAGRIDVAISSEEMAARRAQRDQFGPRSEVMLSFIDDTSPRLRRL